MDMFNEKMIGCTKCGSLYLKEENVFGLSEEKDSSGKLIYKKVQPVKEIRCRDCGHLVMAINANTNSNLVFTQDDVEYYTK